MIHMGVVELALTCGLLLLVIFIPLILSRFYAHLNKRLNDIEKKINKKKTP